MSTTLPPVLRAVALPFAGNARGRPLTDQERAWIAADGSERFEEYLRLMAPFIPAGAVLAVLQMASRMLDGIGEFRRWFGDNLTPVLEVPGAIIAGALSAHGVAPGSLTWNPNDMAVKGHLPRSET